MLAAITVVNSEVAEEEVSIHLGVEEADTGDMFLVEGEVDANVIVIVAGGILVMGDGAVEEVEIQKLAKFLP